MVERGGMRLGYGYAEEGKNMHPAIKYCRGTGDVVR